MICFAGNSNSSIVLTLILSVVTPNLSLNTYARASIVRFSEPVVIVAARTPSSQSSCCLHWHWLLVSLVPLSLILDRSLFYIEFFSSVVHELEVSRFFFLLFIYSFFSFPRRGGRVGCACMLAVVWVKVRMCRNVCESACERGENFSFVYTLPVYVRVWLSAHLSWRLFWNVRHSWRSFRSIWQSVSFSLLLLFFALCTGPGTHCYP